jgi:BCD family chlorophyll transporter-like MFS transporter
MTANARALRFWKKLGTGMLPFADAASPELPLPRLLRLALFQVSVGLVVVLLNGTLNRVMIVELGIPAWLVAGAIAMPVLFAPLRALIGHRSDHHRSAIGWRRVPFIWMGTLIQFGGLAVLPFAMLVLSGRGHYDVPLAGELASASGQASTPPRPQPSRSRPISPPRRPGPGWWRSSTSCSSWGWSAPRWPSAACSIPSRTRSSCR